MSYLQEQKNQWLRTLASAGLTLALTATFGLSGSTYAYAQAAGVTRQHVTDDVRGDFVIEPGKTEIELAPGESVTKVVSVTNRSAEDVSFAIDLEDFTGSDDPTTPVVLLDDEVGPYTLKEYLKPAVREFTLAPGDRISIPITVSIPSDAEPGGRYGAVIVSNRPSVESSNSTAGTGATVISRLGSLFLVRVKGAVQESGSLEDFRIKGGQSVFPHGPLTFEVLFRNNGNVHLTPYGEVTIKNIFGETVGMAPVDAYFSLPNSLRYREVDWNREPLFGRYSATLTLHRGYGDQVDTAMLTFWILPWRWIVISLLVIFIVLLAFQFVRTRFTITRKGQE